MRALRWISGLCLAGGALVGCASPPSVPEPTAVYRLRVAGESEAPRAVLLSLGGLSGDVTILADDAVLAQVTPGTAPLVLLVGPLSGKDLLEVRTATPGTPPAVALIDASAGSAEGYRRMVASEVVVSWEGVP
jgi:hypothetical protein